MNMEGEQGLPLNIFRLTWPKTFVLSWPTNCKNYGLKSESLSVANFWSLLSSLVGRMSIKQSLSLKKLTSSFLMLFFL